MLVRAVVAPVGVEEAVAAVLVPALPALVECLQPVPVAAVPDPAEVPPETVAVSAAASAEVVAAAAVPDVAP